MLILAATIVAVALLQPKTSGTSVDKSAAATAPHTGGHPTSGSGAGRGQKRGSRHSGSRNKPPGLDVPEKRPPRSKAPKVIKATSDNSSVTASTFSLTDETPVTVVYEDTGEKFSAI